MISLRELCVSFNRRTPREMQVISNLSLSIADGEFVTVIGSNGAGKSTLLNTIAGEIVADSGTIALDGNDVARAPVHRRARMVTRVFQNPLDGTCDTLTVEENMAVSACRTRARFLSRALSSVERPRYKQMLSLFGLENRLRDQVTALSGGQRQALSLLMATLAPSRILLLDEPTAALDPSASAQLLELIDRLVVRKGLTTMMVTHSMRDAIAHGTRLIMLHEGRIAFDIAGDDKAKLTVPELMDLFGKLKGTVVDDDRLLLS